MKQFGRENWTLATGPWPTQPNNPPWLGRVKNKTLNWPSKDQLCPPLGTLTSAAPSWGHDMKLLPE